MNIKDEINNISTLLPIIRRDFHMHPELSNEEHRTMKKICEYLDEWGIEYESGVCNTGVIGIVRGAKSGKTVAIRADIDALPIEEANDISYKSKNHGVMHACGHDGHTTILLGAAKLIKSLEKTFEGNVKFFFQPAEETTGGAKPMIISGCMENPHTDHVIGLHISPNIPVGTADFRYGKMNASSDMITLKIKGNSCHGADPQKGIDPIVIASNVVLALQTIISRNIAPTNSAVFTIGSIHGGSKSNIIPDEVTMECILRTLDNDTRDFIQKRIIETVENVATAYGGTGEVIIVRSYDPLINDDSIVEIVKNQAMAVLGEKNIGIIPNPEMFAEDFAYFTQVAKSCFYNLGGRNTSKGIVHPLHNSKFDFDEECLSLGVEIQVRSALALLKQN